MAFTGYVLLRKRQGLPPLEKLTPFLYKACVALAPQWQGEFVVEKDTSKLAMTNNHLNDHVLHIHYSMPLHQKHIVFTVGFTDYDVKKGIRVPGNDHAYVQTTERRCTMSVRVAEAALDLWAEAEVDKFPKPSRPTPIPSPSLGKFPKPSRPTPIPSPSRAGQTVKVRWYGSVHTGTIRSVDAEKETFVIAWAEEPSQSTLAFADILGFL